MKNKRIYYPLIPTQGSYRQPRVVYAFIETNAAGGFVCASIIQDTFIDTITDPTGFVDWLAGLKNGSWVITFNSDYIGALFQYLIDKFIISAYGIQSDVLTLVMKNKKIYMVSIFQFFGTSLYKTAERAGIDADHIAPYKKDNVIEYCQNCVMVICGLWLRIVNFTDTLFGVYPSKTPGATALKCWRVCMPVLLFSKGQRLRGLNQNSISAGGVHWITGHYPNAYKYDVNACYPFVMSIIHYPVTLTGFVNRPAPSSRWIATVRINYKSNHKFSMLAVRLDDGTITHPELAKNLRITLTYIDYQTLALCGEIEIIQWLEGVYWTPEEEVDLFGSWVKKIQNYISHNPNDKIISKVITRALHSKFAQKPKTEALELRYIDERELLTQEIKDVYILDNGKLAAQIIVPIEDKFQAYICPEYEALTQAAAKMIVYPAIDQNTIYIDTDCIISTMPRLDLSIGNDFGQWKLDGYGECFISGPRSYSIDHKVKSSGIRPVDYAALQNAVERAAIGDKTELEAIENIGLSDPMNKRRFKTHTIQNIKYPYSETRGGSAFITASPTVQYPIKFIKRLYSKWRPK